MQLLSYLYRNRERPRFGSGQWWKVWAKRIRTFPRLIQSIFRQSIVKSGGGRIEIPAFVAPCTINGPVQNLSIGKYSFVGRVTLHLHDTISIGTHVIINDGATLFTASHDVFDPSFSLAKRPIVIKNYAWIATGAMILPGVTIGFGSVVGAGAVVTRDVPDLHIAVGNPARLLPGSRSDRFEYRPACLVAAFQAWVGAPTIIRNDSKN
jgi:acetyltransferase-like isoleucine patch superfamily enzyme